MKTDKAELKETPYDEDVREFARDFGLSLNQTRDRFIWAGLQMGDVGPLVCFLLRGYVPGLTVRHILAFMMTSEEALAQTTIKKELLRFRFEIKSRTGKHGPKRSHFEINLRNRRTAKRVKDLMAKIGPGSYEAAIKQIADETGLGVQTVRDSYDESHGKKTAN